MSIGFVNRERELEALGRWWDRRGSSLAAVWGRRRVGKTALLEQFAAGRKVVFHTGTRRPMPDELAALARATGSVTGRDLTLNPFRNWGDALETLARDASDQPVLLVLDEFPELVAVSPELPSLIRATWDRIATATQLRILLCGSAVRTMQGMLEERAPLYGRMDLILPVHPFRPSEAGAMLPRLKPADRAAVWGIVGGVPLYLRWWDQGASIRRNLEQLVCRPAAPLLTEGQLVLATEGDAGDLMRLVLYAIAGGRTKHHEIGDAVRADPTRTLDRLVELRLVERVIPVTEDPRRTRRRLYRIADNFLAFWLGIVARHQAEIERGLGDGIASVIVSSLDDHMGPIYESAFREHLRGLAGSGDLGPEIVAIGPFWTAGDDPNEIDAVALSGRNRRAVLVGEAKWSRRVDGASITRDLRRKAAALPRLVDDYRVAVCGREEVTGDVDLAVTAADIFAAQ